MPEIDLYSFVATITAVCALIATLWQAHLTRTHNRLSVRPMLIWKRSQLITDTGLELAFSIRNCGVGPAVIKDRFFIVNGCRFQPMIPQGDEILELSEAVFANKLRYVVREHGLPGKDATIPQNDEHIIARIFFPQARPSLLDALLDRLDDVTFHLHYESLYGDPFKLNSSA